VVIVRHLGKEVSAFVVHAALERDGGSLGLRLGEFVAVEDVCDSAAVRNHIALEAPFAAQLVLKQKLIGAGGLAVDAVVRAHYRVGLGFSDGGAEGRQIGVD